MIPLRTSVSDDSNDGNAALVLTSATISNESKGKAINTKPYAAQMSMQPPPKPITPGSQMKTSRVSFSDPLETFATPGKPASPASRIRAPPNNESKVDDLAAPSLPNLPPRTVKSKPIPVPLPSVESPLKQLSTANPASPKPSTKRNITDANVSILSKQPEQPSALSRTLPTKRTISEATANDPTTPTSSAPTSPSLSLSKRPRLEELTQKKARLQAELQAKRDRRVAEQKKLEDGKRQHEVQQRLLAEREARLRAEEEERREEEALAAEMEALERENLAEDEEMARLAEEQVMWEGMMGGEMDGT